MRDVLKGFAKCEHENLRCESCGARADYRSWCGITWQEELLTPEEMSGKYELSLDRLRQKLYDAQRQRDEAREIARQLLYDTSCEIWRNPPPWLKEEAKNDSI